MSNAADPRSQLERYIRRVLEMAETDPQLLAMKPLESVAQGVRRPGITFPEILHTVLSGYGPRPALAQRHYRITRGADGRRRREYAADFVATRYDELRQCVEALASALRRHAHHRLAVDDFTCIFGFNSIDFVTIEMAAVHLQATTVPLQTSLAGAELDRIVKDTASPVLFASVADLDIVVSLAIATPTVRSIIVFDYDERDDEERALYESAATRLAPHRHRIRLDPLQALIAFGRRHAWQPLPPHPAGAERIAAIIHSSGSTGTPKGALIPERMATVVWTGTYLQQIPCVGIVFAPMNHFMGRYHVFQTLSMGGTAHFTLKPDLSTLFEDIRTVRPTFISFFPRIFDLIYQHYQSEVLRRVEREGDEAAAAQAVRADMRDHFLGDRLRGGTIGSAPCSPEVKAFVRECFDIMLLEGYGTTEGGIQITAGDRVLRPPVIDYKLRDVPELGYYVTDKPYPRGELLVRSSMQSPGYFKRPEATAALIDEQGYICTGDIMEERGKDHIVYIDRRNDVIKLSQAEFVAVGPLGAIFEAGSPVIRQIYVYGNSERSYLLAVVVPDMEVVAGMIGAAPSESELKALIRAEMTKVAAASNLRSFEVPRDFLIEHEPFSHENGLLSSVQKRMRPNFKKKYGERLEALYAQIERKRQDELLALRDPHSPLNTLQKVLKALEATLGIEGLDAQSPQGFRELGGDSIGAASFALLLQDIFGVEVPLNNILSPAGHPKAWARFIDAAQQGHAGAATFESIHGKGATVVDADQLDIVKFLGQRLAGQVPQEPPVAKSRVVLLTGANGFLGRHLCLQWMETLAGRGGKVICLVRGADAQDARRRLDAVFSGLDQSLERHYRELAATHLEVIAGDVAEVQLGLTQQQWDRLAAEVDHVVHPAALVNHRLSYQHLFGPNVVGTAELVRLALSQRQKRFDFVSSAAVNLLLEGEGPGDEDSPLRQRVTLSEEYAAGYGASKWAGEWLLRSANRRFGLPVNIFRGDMIMPHTRYRGQINVPDMITRLLYSIVMTGIAPETFYERKSDEHRPRAHYDGLPVDFIAGAMIGIGADQHRECRVFNVQNDHDDGISLDSFVDWVQSAGYPVERIADHARWAAQFEARLSTLTERQRQHSSLNILGYLRQPHAAHQAPCGSSRFKAAVQRLPVGPSVPHLDEAYIHKYLDDMRVLGLIGEPAARR